MALSAAIEWDLRPTNGSDTNGGGFKRGASGTDWSQQNAAQYAVTDAVTNGTTTITSATANFGTDVVGNVLYIAGGTAPITAGWYEITGRTNATTITVDRSTGLTAGTGATLNIGGALKTLGQAMTNWVASNTIWWKNEAYSISAGIAPAAVNALPNARPNMIIGYNASHGDNPTGSTRPTISASAAIDMLNIADNNVLVAFIIFDAASTANRCLRFSGTSPNRGGRVCYCAFRNFKVAGYLGGGDQTYVFACEAIGGVSGATAGFLGSSIYVNCWSRGNPCHGFSNNGDSVGTIYDGCVSAGNTGATTDGYNFDSNALGNVLIKNCVAYGNGRSGVRFQGSYTATNIVNSIFEGNGGYGIDFAYTISIAVPFFDYNAFYNNTSGARNNITAGVHDVTLTGSPFTNASGGDFSLNNTAGAGAACRAAGYPGVFPAALTTGYLDIGAVQHQDAGGSSYDKSLIVQPTGAY